MHDKLFVVPAEAGTQVLSHTALVPRVRADDESLGDVVTYFSNSR